ncbi:hypothetical protein ACIPSA_24235 [Streptomyces sp. NPDC086549]|uniref:hypothetical protein n=1 Tax=Streptomyces sp. NPDC086549 TaxID=3365752 RepID=UPI003825DEC0
MSTTRRPRRGRTWPRVLVLLLVLLVPGTRAELHAAPVVSADVVDHDTLDTALRPPSRTAPRPAVPGRPASSLPDPAPAALAVGPPYAAPQPPYALHTLRSVVLRC